MVAAARPAVDPRRDHRRPRHRRQRPDGPARRQPPRPSALLGSVRRPGSRPNFARFTFLDSASHRFYPDWDFAADTCRGDAAHRCRPRPARQEPARPRRRAVHPQRGVPPPLELPRRPASTAPARSTSTTTPSATSTLAYESLDLVAEPGLTLTIYAAEPASSTAHALALLASWAATQELDPAIHPS